VFDLEMDFDGDWAKMLDRLKPWDVAGVIPGCECGVELADTLSEKLGVASNGTALSAARRDKFLMQEALRRAGLRSIDSLRTRNLDELIEWARRHNSWPVVLKPLRSTGTQGLHFCDHPEALQSAFRELTESKNFFGDSNDEILVQECVTGTEYPVNTVSLDGTHCLTDLWVYRKLRMGDSPPIYDYCRLLPYPEGTLAALRDYTFKVLDALGVRHGAAHSEIMLTATGPVLIECGARVMGGSFPPDLIVECVGHNQLELLLDACLDPSRFRQKAAAPYRLKKHLLAKFLISSREGALREIPGINLVAGLATAHSGNFLGVLTENRVHRTVDLFTSPAHFILFDADESRVMADYQIIRDLEEEAQNLLFAATPEWTSPDDDGEWFKKIPDEHWLKPEADVAADAEVIARAVQLRPGMRILDCPCGDARVGVHLASSGADYTGVDINPRFIAKARERFLAAKRDGTLSVGDMRALEYRDEFDVICNWFNSFGYFGAEEDLQVMKRLVRALRPGGRLITESPNRAQILKNIRSKFTPDGRKIEPHWDTQSEEIAVDIPVETPEGSLIVHTHAHMYSLAQYKLFFRLAGLEFDGVFGEGLSAFDAEKSRRMILLAHKP
jgi:SAM-dependent methyltransferase/predicted ATP-grasp superfamily ATP-dependent carboligase